MEMKNLVDGKTINLELIGLDGNAFSLMAAFRQQALREGWIPDEINKVLDEAMSDDYNHLVATLAIHCSPLVED